ncbi:hypothetical protein PG984_000036 [Apiospora sp. TS-2023a]
MTPAYLLDVPSANEDSINAREVIGIIKVGIVGIQTCQARLHYLRPMPRARIVRASDTKWSFIAAEAPMLVLILTFESKAADGEACLPEPSY